jgi:hypothetical protein
VRESADRRDYQTWNRTLPPRLSGLAVAKTKT